MKQTETIDAINTDELPKHFDSRMAEERLTKRWEQLELYRFDPNRSRAETFVVDTPPPTVSGSLHVGHIFSYSHTDFLVRQQRMSGKNIFYPMGWDDNGLPTERRVQNYFHVRADVQSPPIANLQLEPATAEQAKAPPKKISRPNFIEACHQVTAQDELAFKALWQRIGLSVDWHEEYATIASHSRTMAQLSFLDLWEKGHVYSMTAPTMWDVDFQTAVAQAEVEERPQAGAYHHIEFAVADSPATLVIATTRPELLAACVGITAHPDDARYQSLFGKRAITPLYGVTVPIFPSDRADPEKGTGVLMVCTFGDATDVQWWRERSLPLRQIIGRDGRLLPIAFGTPGWESVDAPRAQRFYDAACGKTLKAARAVVAEQLRLPESAARSGLQAALRQEPQKIERPVKFFEKGDQPLEFISTRQWFVRLLDKKEQLLAHGARIQWHPEHMGLRYRNWTENLQFDWCISRQRYFGVPFPLWYPLDAHGAPRFDAPIVAPRQMLPVDPTVTTPPGFTADQRHQPGGFIAETDVFDTWFTSSLTPQIATGWLNNPQRHQQLFPGDVRPQSHEIIRTWAFYTIAKAMLHEQTIPWKSVLISGWVLDPDRKKMSKSRGNVVTPMHLIDQYGADAVRYWAASARLGTDTAFDEQTFKVGKRLVTKLFNAGKYILSQSAATGPITTELDRAFVWKLADTVRAVTAAYGEYEFAPALEQTERFFWGSLTDVYLELVKTRARGELPAEQAGRTSAVQTLRLALSVLLRLFAPVLPFITEEIWGWSVAGSGASAATSIHKAPWPSAAEFAAVAPPENAASFALAESAFAAINKSKSELGAGIGRPLKTLQLAAHPTSLAFFAAVRSDVLAAVRCRAATLVERNDLPLGQFQVLAAELEPVADKPAPASPTAP